MKFAHNLGDFALAFEPEALSGKDLDEFYYKDTMPIRMGDDYVSPMNNIFISCKQPKSQNAHLLLGHIGCGKSTELNELKRRFEADGYMVSVIRCVSEAALPNIVDSDLLILLGKHLCKIAEDAQCPLSESLLTKIEKFWKEIEIVETRNIDRNLGIKGKISALFLGLSNELRFGYAKRATIRERVKNSASEWVGYMNEVSGHITQHFYGKQPIVIFEDLGRLSAEKAWEIFDNNSLSQMSFPIIYTCPISLSYYPKFRGLDASYNTPTLPMIKIRDLNRNPFSAGIDTIKAIVKKRADLSLFDEDALSLLIDKTGGVLRDLFRCILQAAARTEARKAEKIELEDAQSATNQLRLSLTRLIETKNYPLLKNIYEGGKYKSQIEDKETLMEMIYGQIVLEYHNGKLWFDLHPLIEDYLREQGEV
ncbi:MAG: ATP-binding protein [Planctomycetaceae bacterium]|nr:ATP-binding protein [Planctomycetaceae bacterium]